MAIHFVYCVIADNDHSPHKSQMVLETVSLHDSQNHRSLVQEIEQFIIVQIDLRLALFESDRDTVNWKMQIPRTRIFIEMTKVAISRSLWVMQY